MSLSLQEAVDMVQREFYRARALHPIPFNSRHEGFAVLKEEVDELWDDIKANAHLSARKEAIQVAAMALRFLVEVS